MLKKYRVETPDANEDIKASGFQIIGNTLSFYEEDASTAFCRTSIIAYGARRWSKVFEVKGESEA